jgi:uncharacterized caspase-like protein
MSASRRQSSLPRSPRRGLAALCGLVLLAACGANPQGASARKVALVIGNAAYENAPVLVNPTNDAADMCAALRRVGFRTLCHTNLRDRAEFDARVREYAAQLGPDTVGVFYYSGHGVQAGQANFLIPTKADADNAAADPLRVLYGVDDLFERLRGRPARFQLVVLDACRDDLFGDAPATPAAPAATAPPGPATGRGRGPAARTRLLRSLESVARANTGLAPIKDAPPGTMVLYATASKEAAFDGEGRNGPLTKHLLQHIGTRGLTVEELIKRVTAGVETETLRDFRKRQTPFIYGSFSGRFCFAGCPGESDVPPAF